MNDSTVDVAADEAALDGGSPGVPPGVTYEGSPQMSERWHSTYSYIEQGLSRVWSYGKTLMMERYYDFYFCMLCAVGWPCPVRESNQSVFSYQGVSQFFNRANLPLGADV